MWHAATRGTSDDRLGGEGAWDHVNPCLHRAPNWTCAHDHVLRALESICNDAGFATNHKRVLTSDGNSRADLEIRNIRVAQQTDLLVDVTLRHNFIGTGQIGPNQGQLRNPDNPDHILESAAADKIRNYRNTYRRNRHEAFLPACMSTSGRIHRASSCD
jgi:transcriptional regulator of met regulon